MASSASRKRPAVLLFDVFGTVVDWRGSVSREIARIGRAHGVRADWGEFADAWRAGYRPAMDRVRRGEAPWQPLDSLHLTMLRGLVGRFGLELDASELAALNLVWHRLSAWRDVRAGLRRLKRGCIIGTLSNGNMALLVELSKAAGLPWDCILSSELFRHYKPDPEVYLGAVALLALDPAQVMLVAAHKDDLAAARRCGLQTAYVHRPLEFGPDTAHGGPDRRSTLNADDFEDLADQLGL
jgi:2-haloacid dehalogenase